MSDATSASSTAVVKGKAAKGGKNSHALAAAAGTGKLSTLALTMMTVTTLAGIANDVQQSFYGLSAVTYFAIGALVFFVPTGLVAAELASGWSQRGGIFRWVGEGLGSFPAITCLLILWFQTSFSFGSGIPGSSATIGFFTTNFDWAVDFAKTSHSWKITLPIMLGWLVYYWVVCWLATKGVKVFANIAKYGVIFGTFLPLGVMTILAVVWLCEGHTPCINMSPSGLIPQWNGMSTLALAAGVFFSFAGIDMNAAHIKDLKHPQKQFPVVVFISMILAFLIFVIGTVIIAMVIPNKQINLLYTLFATYRELGATIGFPDLYVVFVYLGMANSFAALITNLAGPSYMLGQAGRSGFLPKFLQNNNKHGMPSRMMYAQMLFMTLIAFIVFFLPNVEGFVALITQAITILYMMYYVLMFVAFLRLRYQQPNRPRGFRVPGGMFGAWLVAGIGIAASVFGIVLAFYPPAQLSAEVGSGTTYDIIIAALIIFVVAVCALLYKVSRKHQDWVDPTNEFAPFTWQIEGLKKPQKVQSNIPTAILSEGQDPMGMPIKHHFDPDQMMSELGDAKNPAAQAAATAQLLKEKGIQEPDAPKSISVFAPEVAAGVKTLAFAGPEPQKPITLPGMAKRVDVPAATAEQIEATDVPTDPQAALNYANEKAKQAKSLAERYEVEAQAYEDQAQEDQELIDARKHVKEATAAAVQAESLAEQTASNVATAMNNVDKAFVDAQKAADKAVADKKAAEAQAQTGASTASSTSASTTSAASSAPTSTQAAGTTDTSSNLDDSAKPAADSSK